MQDIEYALKDISVLVDADLDEESVLNVYRKSLTGHPAIHVCYVLLTDHCNLRCSYCFVQNALPSNYRQSNMTPKTASAAVEFFYNATLRARHQNNDGEYTLIFYGGEPSLNVTALKSALKISRELSFPGKLKIALITNGTMVDKDLALLAEQYDIGISVSMDGPADITDRWRNQGTYEKALRGFQLLRESGLNPGISCTLPPDSLLHFNEIIDWLLYLNVRNVGFNLVTRPAIGYDSPKYYRDATQALLKAFERFRKDGIYEDRIMRKIQAFVAGKPYAFDCAACGGAQIVVAPDGSLGICHALLGDKATFVSNVFERNFIPEHHPVWQEWSKRSPLNIVDCLRCECLGICGGGCPVNNHENIWKLDKGFCEHAITILNWMVWDVFTQQKSYENSV